MDRVEADHLARQMKAEDLFAAFLVDQRSLHRAGTNREDRLEFLAGVEDVVAGVERADMLDQEMQFLQGLLVVAARQADFAEGASRAEMHGIAIAFARILQRESTYALADAHCHHRDHAIAARFSFVARSHDLAHRG